jgi:hypothetical protein
MLEERQRWSDDTSINGLPVGGPLWMAAQEVVDAFAKGTIPASCRNLCRAVEEFTKHWRAHVTQAEMSPKDDLLPGNNVWSCIDTIAAARTGATPKAQKQLEPVAELVNQKVSLPQIAKIYDWYDEFGSPDVAKVRDAINNPGKHDGQGYVKQIAEKEQKRRELDRLKTKQMQEKIGKKAQAAPTPGPEKIETLVAQGLSAAQIAKVKVMPVGSVLKYCSDHGLELEPSIAGASGSTDGSPTPAGNSFDPDDDAGPLGALEDELEVEVEGEDDEFGPDDGQPLSLEEQILLAYENDPEQPPKDIAKLLGTSSQKVAAVLRRRQEVEQPTA